MCVTTPMAMTMGAHHSAAGFASSAVAAVTEMAKFTNGLRNTRLVLILPALVFTVTPACPRVMRMAIPMMRATTRTGRIASGGTCVATATSASAAARTAPSAVRGGLASSPSACARAADATAVPTPENPPAAHAATRTTQPMTAVRMGAHTMSCVSSRCPPATFPIIPPSARVGAPQTRAP